MEKRREALSSLAGGIPWTQVLVPESERALSLNAIDELMSGQMPINALSCLDELDGPHIIPSLDASG
jgi:hypothetical protein